MSSVAPYNQPVLVSACLLGLRTRYDGHSKHNQTVVDYLKKHQLIPIPVCPEQLAGMSTPRKATYFKLGSGADVINGSGIVVSSTGDCMNDVFCRGAEEVLKIALISGCQWAIFKERSPSCGVHQIYCESEKVKGLGVTTALLSRAGITVLSEDDVQ